jgi:hypothetical protein
MKRSIAVRFLQKTALQEAYIEKYNSILESLKNYN